jgi:hypothetical protein
VTPEETRALKDHIVRLYYARYTCRQIADLTGLAYRYVRDSLTERGIKPGSRLGRYSRTKVAQRAAVAGPVATRKRHRGRRRSDEH